MLYIIQNLRRIQNLFEYQSIIHKYYRSYLNKLWDYKVLDSFVSCDQQAYQKHEIIKNQLKEIIINQG